MPKITVNNQEYEMDTLSDEAKSQIASLQFVDAELARLNSHAAVLQTARIAYGKSLEAALTPSFESDTLKFN